MTTRPHRSGDLVVHPGLHVSTLARSVNVASCPFSPCRMLHICDTEKTMSGEGRGITPVRRRSGTLAALSSPRSNQ